MKRLAQFLRRIGDALGWPRITVTDPVCVVCTRGRSDVLGLPIYCRDGYHRHLMCMTIDRQLAEAAVQQAARAPERPPTDPPAGKPPSLPHDAIVTYRAQLSGSWN